MFPIAGKSWPTAPALLFGYRRSATHVHQGVDIAAPRGTPVRAPAAGRIVAAHSTWARGFTGYGRVVVLRTELEHMPPLYMLFAHLESVGVQEGQQVQAGDVLGTVGASQFSEPTRTNDFTSGPHLHWEVSHQPYPMGSEAANRIDPKDWFSSSFAFDQAAEVVDNATKGGGLLIGALLVTLGWALLKGRTPWR
jgi:murein DD-endopeptidase MepM/ murein hydrolase activator NlpD